MLENASLLSKHITHGVYVISVANGTEQNAFTAAWVMQVSFDPPMIAFSINPEHYSYQLLKAGGVCTVNVLGQDHLAIAAHFGQSGIKEKMTKEYGFNHEAMLDIDTPQGANDIASNISSYVADIKEEE